MSAEITALLAYTALRSNDKVGLIIFSDHVEHYIPPKKGRGHVWSLIRDILSFKSRAKKTDISVPIDFMNKVMKKKAITFLISDFQGEGFENKLRSFSRKHDLVAISVTDPREIEIPNIGYIELEDAETGESLLINTSDLSGVQSFSKKAKTALREKKKFFQKNGIDFLDVRTDGSYFDTLIKFFRERERKR